MRRPFLIAALIASSLSAQTPEHQFQEAWTRYIRFDLSSSPRSSQPNLPVALDDLGTAWAAWAEAEGPGALTLPSLPVPPATEAVKASAHLLGHQGPWTLMGLEVPVPCGSHMFVALFKEMGPRWTLTMLDSHEPRNESDPLGARENDHVLLVEGPKVVIASTPPWCTSCWSVLHVRVLTPGADPGHPRTLTRFEDRIYRCTEDGAFTMTPVKGGVSLRYQGQASDAQIAAGLAMMVRRRLLRVP